jgi:hypothetical protein
MKTIHHGPANLFRGFEGVGGMLTLTSDRLVFRPHVMNIQRQEETIELADIECVEKANTLGLVPNGFKVVTADAEFRFVVSRRTRWIGKIQHEIETLSTQPA